MTRAQTRTNFHSSKLIRVLSDMAIVDAVEPGIAFADKLGLWLDLNDAIRLHAVHSVSPPAPVRQSAAESISGGGLGEELARIRAILVNSITKSGSPKRGRTKIEIPSSKHDAPIEVASAYEPYRRYYLAHQREMDLSIRPLRVNVREELARASPALRQLAALDAALDATLCDRERKLLSTVPSLLERRFEQLLKTHQQKLVDAQQEDNPTLWMKPGAWLACFCNDMRSALLAELEVRLQPTVGLIEAFNNDTTRHR